MLGLGLSPKFRTLTAYWRSHRCHIFWNWTPGLLHKTSSACRFPFSVDGNSKFPFVQAKQNKRKQNLESFLTPHSLYLILHIQCLEILLAYPPDYVQNLTPCHHLPCFHPGPTVIICCLDYCSSLLTTPLLPTSALLQPVLNTETTGFFPAHVTVTTLPFKSFQCSQCPSTVKARVHPSPSKAPLSLWCHLPLFLFPSSLTHSAPSVLT